MAERLAYMDKEEEGNQIVDYKCAFKRLCCGSRAEENDINGVLTVESSLKSRLESTIN